MTTLTFDSRLDRLVTEQPHPLKRKFRRDSLAPAAARTFVVSTLVEKAEKRVSQDILGVAELLTSELVTNAYQSANRGQIRVKVQITEKQVLVVVTDAGRTRAALPAAAPDDDSEHGRGWMLIEALADDSGIERIPGGNGHRAWFALNLDGGAS